jgi:hypothetical protein
VLLPLGTGHPWHAIDGGLTPFPLMGLLLTLLLIRFLIRLPLGIGSVVMAIALGTLFSTAVDTWGFTLPTSVWILGAVIVSGLLSRTWGALGSNPSD